MSARHLTLPVLLAGALFTLGVGAHAQTVTGNFTAATVGSTVNLTLEGTSDWAKYDYSGDSNSPVSFVDKLTGGGQISNATLQYGYFQSPSETNSATNPTTFSWADGTPTLANPGTTQGLEVNSDYRDAQFTFTAPADMTPRTLRVYLGEGGADAGTFTATLTGGTSYTNILASSAEGFYTLTYTGTAPGQTLTINLKSASTQNFDDVHLYAATLQVSSLAAAPEPSQAAAFGVGLLGLSALGLRARRRPASAHA